MKLSVREALKDKHPESFKFPKSADLPMMQDLSYTAFHPNIFDSLESDCVRRCALTALDQQELLAPMLCIGDAYARHLVKILVI